MIQPASEKANSSQPEVVYSQGVLAYSGFNVGDTDHSI